MVADSLGIAAAEVHMPGVLLRLAQDKVDGADLAEGVLKLEESAAAAVQAGVGEGNGVDAGVAVGVVPAISLVPVRPALRSQIVRDGCLAVEGVAQHLIHAVPGQAGDIRLRGAGDVLLHPRPFIAVRRCNEAAVNGDAVFIVGQTVIEHVVQVHSPVGEGGGHGLGVPAGRIEQLLIGVKLLLRNVAGGGALRIGGGFDTLEECFEDLSGHIHALETGLSSDPPMNWRVSALDRFVLVSNSDAHSPAKLGREANLLETGRSYPELAHAIQTGEGFYGTIEFFPEEGKYHYDGHRKCHICLSPEEAEKYHGICPVCGKKLTMGVNHRIMDLADRENGFVRKNARPFESIVPLPEVISACVGKAVTTKTVTGEYEKMLQKLGNEFDILREIPIADIEKESSHMIASGIRKLRNREVICKPGFDGEYGKICLF